MSLKLLGNNLALERLNWGRVVLALGFALVALWFVFLFLPLPSYYNFGGMLRVSILTPLTFVIFFLGVGAMVLSRFGYELFDFGMCLALALPLAVIGVAAESIPLKGLTALCFLISISWTAWFAKKRL